MVRALASHQCGPGSIPGLGVICGVSLLLVIVPAPRVFLQVLRFSSFHKNQHFQIPIRPGNSGEKSHPVDSTEFPFPKGDIHVKVCMTKCFFFFLNFWCLMKSSFCPLMKIKETKNPYQFFVAAFEPHKIVKFYSGWVQYRGRSIFIRENKHLIKQIKKPRHIHFECHMVTITEL